MALDSHTPVLIRLPFEESDFDSFETPLQSIMAFYDELETDMAEGQMKKFEQEWDQEVGRFLTPAFENTKVSRRHGKRSRRVF